MSPFACSIHGVSPELASQAAVSNPSAPAPPVNSHTAGAFATARSCHPVAAPALAKGAATEHGVRRGVERMPPALRWPNPASCGVHPLAGSCRNHEAGGCLSTTGIRFLFCSDEHSEYCEFFPRDSTQRRSERKGSKTRKAASASCFTPCSCLASAAGALAPSSVWPLCCCNAQHALQRRDALPLALRCAADADRRRACERHLAEGNAEDCI